MNYLFLFLKSRKLLIASITFTALLQAFGMLLIPYFVSAIIDRGIAHQDIDTIIIIGVLMLVTAGITALIALLNSYLSADISALTGKYLRERIFEKTQQLSVKEFDHIGTASLITRTTSDITIIQQTMIMIVQMILPTPLVAFVAIIMTALTHASLVYIPLIATGFFFVVVYVLFNKGKLISETIQRRVDKINRVVRESLIGIRVIRAFDNTQYERQRTNEAFTEYADNVIRLNRLFALFNPFIWAIMGLSMGAVVWFGGYLVIQQEIEVGSIAATTEYTIIMLVYLMMSAMVMVMIPRMVASLDRIEEVLDIVPEIVDQPTAITHLNADTPHQLVFNNVTFAYKGAEKAVLENLNFICEPGKTTAIIGGTGSGKSTIAGLMLRLYDIQSGEILLNGVDIRHLTQHQLREQIGYIPQKAFLFSGTIADNLRMGNRDATMEQIQRAATIAQAHPFISALDAGYVKSNA
jgi:ATP-binding cassette subfamily B multidrug efflux pump